LSGYIFDTNIFNEILDGSIDPSFLPRNGRFYVTHIQSDEIRATRNAQRREQLERIFSDFPSKNLPTASFVLDHSRLGMASLSDGEVNAKLRNRLVELGGENRGNVNDVLIAETAILSGLTLVTHDMALFRTVTEFEGAACNLHCLTKGQ